MDRNYNNSEFEQFLKDAADQHRMYPSDKVWNRIYSSLHFRSRWRGYGFTILLLSLGTGSLFLLNNPDKKEPITFSTFSDNTFVLPDDISLISSQNFIRDISKTSFNKNKLPVQPASAVIRENSVAQNSSVSENITEQSEMTSDNNGNTFNELSEPVTADNITDQDFYTNALVSEGEIKTSEIVAKPNNTAALPSYEIEKAVSSIKAVTQKRKTSLQFYFTPTVSYRKLTENKSYLLNVSSSSSTSLANNFNVNDLVTHKPDMGLEFGVAAKIPVTKKTTIRTGLQMNINRYEIKAFSYPAEIATIALNSGSGVDNLLLPSRYRNLGIYSQDWLQNFYFQMSAPVGVEVIIGKSKGVQFGIAGTIQPTYLLRDRIYLISTDYRNYTEVPWLVRRWNMNTSLETFVLYSTGKMNWQVGPQVRYQLLSSYIDKYPVKENLFDIGLRVGVSFNK